MTLTWAAAPDGDTLSALNALAHDTSYVGHSASLVRMRFLAHSADAQTDDRSTGSPYPGRLDELVRLHRRHVGGPEFAGDPNARPRRAGHVPAPAAEPKRQVYKPSRFATIVRKIATDAGLTGFTLDACRHGGLTELEEAGLTEGQGMALSMHKTARIYRNYSKRTQSRAVGATLRRLAHRRANAP